MTFYMHPIPFGFRGVRGRLREFWIYIEQSLGVTLAIAFFATVFGSVAAGEWVRTRWLRIIERLWGY